jgi:hypothetical protein
MSIKANQKPSAFMRLLAFLGRIILSVLLFAGLVWVAAFALQPWHNQWGATSDEASMQLPGDEIVPNAAHQATLGITVAAPPEEVWPWLAQLGADRGGLYSYAWFEGLMNCPIHNADRIIPELQNPQVGDLVRMCPGDFGPPPHEIAEIQPNRAFIFGGRDDSDTYWDSSWQFVLVPHDGGTTRLLLRLHSVTYSTIDAIMEPAFFLMERRRLQGIQERAEGQFRAEWLSESEILLWITSFFGFLIAGAILVFRRAWRIPASLAGLIALITLFLVFVQPPLWVDGLCVLAVYAGLVWVIRLTRKPDLSLRTGRI